MKQQKSDKNHVNPSGLTALAIGLITAGILFLLRNFGLLPYTLSYLLLSWQMLLIFMGVWLICRKQKTAGFVLITLGCIFILPRLAYLYPEWGLNFWLIIRKGWPAFLILLVGYIYFNQKASKEYLEMEETALDQDSSSESTDSAEPLGSADARPQANTTACFLTENISFSSSVKQLDTQNLLGANLNVVFGSLILDLRKAKPKDDKVIIKLSNVFSSATLYVPRDWRVLINSQPVLGSITDRRNKQNPTTATNPTQGPLLILSGSCTFGSTEIRS